jgi:hypothetical protein
MLGDLPDPAKIASPDVCWDEVRIANAFVEVHSAFLGWEGLSFAIRQRSTRYGRRPDLGSWAFFSLTRFPDALSQ